MRENEKEKKREKKRELGRRMQLIGNSQREAASRMCVPGHTQLHATRYAF